MLSVEETRWILKTLVYLRELSCESVSRSALIYSLIKSWSFFLARQLFFVECKCSEGISFNTLPMVCLCWPAGVSFDRCSWSFEFSFDRCCAMAL